MDHAHAHEQNLIRVICEASFVVFTSARCGTLFSVLEHHVRKVIHVSRDSICAKIDFHVLFQAQFHVGNVEAHLTFDMVSTNKPVFNYIRCSYQVLLMMGLTCS
jgi:hypothetical protein